MNDASQLSNTRSKLHEEMQFVPPHVSLPHTASWIKFLDEDSDLYKHVLELEVTDDLPKVYNNLLNNLTKETHLFAACEELGIMSAVHDGFEHKPSEMTQYAYEELVFKKHQVEYSYLSASPHADNIYLYGAWPDRKSFVYSLTKDGILPWELHKYIHAKIHRLYKEQSWLSKMMQKFSPTEQPTELIEVQAFRASLLPVHIVSGEELVDYMRLAVDENGVSIFPLLDLEKARFAVHIIDALNALHVPQKHIATMIRNRGTWHGKQYRRLYHAVVDMAHERGFHEAGLKHLIYEETLQKIREMHKTKKLAQEELKNYKPLVLRSSEEMPKYLTPHTHA